MWDTFKCEGMHFFITYVWASFIQENTFVYGFKGFLSSQLTHDSWVQMKEKVLHAIKRRSGRRIAWINAEPFWLPYIEASPGTYLVYITVECVIINDSWGVFRWKGLSASLMRGTLHDLNKMWASLAILLCKGGHRFENNVEYLMVLSRQHKQTHTHTHTHTHTYTRTVYVCTNYSLQWNQSLAVSPRTWGSKLLHSVCLHRDLVFIL